VIIAEGGSRSTCQAFDRFGYREIARDFQVKLVDLNRDSHTGRITIFTDSGGRHDIGYSDLAAAADTIVSVAVAKTHDAAMVTLSLKNMMGCLKRVKRPRMHGIRIGSIAETTAETLWNIIEDHSWVIKTISGAMFCTIKIGRTLQEKITGGRMPGLLAQCRAISENLAILGTVLMPDVAVIDAFEAMEGDGPGGGTAVPMNLAVAGTDPVACDAVMAYMMGFDPLSVGYLALCHERGLGIADMKVIDTVGEDPRECMKRFVPHNNYPYQLRWRDAWTD
jgi:uncharacterized protein (DUF362 family)